MFPYQNFPNETLEDFLLPLSISYSFGYQAL
nr:MAG TPA: hypothetical protein [Bacteriophage sp.]